MQVMIPLVHLWDEQSSRFLFHDPIRFFNMSLMYLNRYITACCISCLPVFNVSPGHFMKSICIAWHVAMSSCHTQLFRVSIAKDGCQYILSTYWNSDHHRFASHC